MEVAILVFVVLNTLILIGLGAAELFKDDGDAVLKGTALEEGVRVPVWHEGRYQFVGKSTPGLPYRKGRPYNLKFVDPKGMGELAITRHDGVGFCPYETWAAFDENWRPADLKKKIKK